MRRLENMRNGMALSAAAVLLLWSQPVLGQRDMEQGRPRQTMEEYRLQGASDQTYSNEAAQDLDDYAPADGMEAGQVSTEPSGEYLHSDNTAGVPMGAPELSSELSAPTARHRSAVMYGRYAERGARQSVAPPCAGEISQR